MSIVKKRVVAGLIALLRTDTMSPARRTLVRS